jgi:hypothetical protein
MYKDFTDDFRIKKDVEQELSKLERQTAEILQKVKKSHENGDPAIWLTRVERNKLRKFLFLMKYRGPGYFNKYIAEDPQAYDAEDKHVLRDYMVDKGFTKPRDVWLHNLRTILQVNMDPEGKWFSKLRELMFPEDADMFIFHCQSSYMAFCTPAEKLDEFVLTDHCYNVFEGPTTERLCVRNGMYIEDAYLCYHEFGPISSKLIIVLRSNLLPQEREDCDPKIRKSRQRQHNAALVQFQHPNSIKSLRADLNVTKATKSYSKIVDGKLKVIPGESGPPRTNDKFCFRFWSISTKTKHVGHNQFCLFR